MPTQVCKCHKELVSIYDGGRPVCERTRLICDVWTEAVVNDGQQATIATDDEYDGTVPVDYDDPFVLTVSGGARYYSELNSDGTVTWMRRVVARAIDLAPDERAKHVLQLLWVELV